jgi:hypothetical protein
LLVYAVPSPHLSALHLADLAPFDNTTHVRNQPKKFHAEIWNFQDEQFFTNPTVELVTKTSDQPGG